MIKIDWLKVFASRVWFGWYYYITEWDDGDMTGRWLWTTHKGFPKRHHTTVPNAYNTKKTLEKLDMITIDWERFFSNHVIFGWTYLWVWVSDGSVNEMKWVYSDSWFDRLWPFRKMYKLHPAWWTTGITWIIKAIKAKSIKTAR